MLEADFRTRMLANSDVMTLTSGRFAEGHKPQGSAYPSVTFRRVSTQYAYCHDGRSLTYWARIMLNVWSKSPDQARQVAAAIVAAIKTFDLTLAPESPEPVLTTSPNMVLNQFADEWPDPEPTIYRERLDLKIWFTE